MALRPEMLGEQQRVSRREATIQQIHMAIRLFHEREFACAITLALAAEDQLPDSAESYLFKLFQVRAPDAVAKFNHVRNWLKHHKEPDTIDLFEFEAVIALARAASKYTAVYPESTREVEGFIQWSRERDYLNKVKPRR